VRFADCIEEGRLLALSTQQLSLQLDSTQLRGEALKLVQNMNKHITCDEKAVEANGSQGKSLLQLAGQLTESMKYAIHYFCFLRTYIVCALHNIAL
jgi:IS5 family transposase